MRKLAQSRGGAAGLAGLALLLIVLTMPPLAARSSGAVTVVLSPSSTTVAPGSNFNVAIQLQAGTQQVDSAEFHLNFDPSKLQVVDGDASTAGLQIAPGTALGMPLQNVVDNTSGTIDYSAGTFSGFPTGTFTLASVTFKALAPTGAGGTPLTFVFSGARRTDVFFAGNSVFGGSSNGSVVVSAPPSATPSGLVYLGLNPSAATLGVGEQLAVQIVVQAGSQPVDSAEAHINFDPTKLQVIDSDAGTAGTQVAAGAALSAVLQNQVDNAAGTVDFAAGTFSSFPSGTFTLASVTFAAIAPTSPAATNLAFVSAAYRRTDVFFGGTSKFGGATDGALTVVAAGTTPTRTPTATPTATPVGPVQLEISPSNTTAASGSTFTVTIQVQAGIQQVDSVEAHLDFDATKLQVVDSDVASPGVQIAAGSSLATLLQNTADNTSGKIDYAAGSFTTLPAGTFTLASITFQAVASTDPASTPLHFVFTSTRRTDAYFAGSSVFGGASDGAVTVQAPSPTVTPTPSPTATRTPTATPTTTDTATATGTPSPTLTVTITPSPSQTPSLTASPTSTRTSTPTPSTTSTDTPTSTMTHTATASSTNTATSPTPTDTATVTQTNTPTATNTASPSSTPSVTPSPTSTNTLTPTRTQTPPPVATTIASDDFECGSFSCGTGAWVGPWATSAPASINTSGPHSGTRQVLLNSSTGRATRVVNIAGKTNVHWQLWAKIYSFESSDHAMAEASTDGVVFNPVHSWGSGDAANSYRFWDFDLSGAPYQGATQLTLRLRAAMSDSGDYFYFDDVVVTGISATQPATSTPTATSAATATASATSTATTAPSPTPTAPATSTATPTPSPTTATSSPTATPTATSTSLPPDLALSKTASAANVAAGGTFTYTLAVANVGGSSSSGTTIDDALPPEVTFGAASAGCSFLGGHVSCLVPARQPGDGSVFVFSVAATTGGEIRNSATVAAVSGETSVGNNQATVVVNAGLTVTPTPTPAATATPSVTQTSSSTPTGTPASTSTGTPQPTYTPTPTVSPTDTGTPAPSDTPTSTPAPTSTSTATAQPTNTPTATMTPTPTTSPTATRTPTPLPVPTTIASDDFECGSFSCGSGAWVGPWTTSTPASINTSGPHSGTRQVLLNSSTGRATRVVNVDGRSNLRLQLWAKIYSFESGDQAVVEVAVNGSSTFTVLRTWTSGDAANSYRFYDFDLSGAAYQGATQLTVRLRAAMNDSGDYFYFDDVVIIGR